MWADSAWSVGVLTDDHCHYPHMQRSVKTPTQALIDNIIVMRSQYVLFQSVQDRHNIDMFSPKFNIIFSHKRLHHFASDAMMPVNKCLMQYFEKILVGNTGNSLWTSQQWEMDYALNSSIYTIADTAITCYPTAGVIVDTNRQILFFVTLVL